MDARLPIPAHDVRRESLEPSPTRAVCPYKGEASYRSLRLEEERLDDVAWSYPDPPEDASRRPDTCASRTTG
ncbi:DUF427 domain-containing protein [Nonomuraea sp. SYSU D8015]|uniref:DUF427 domain-containing protein n=1 Tax=Nonomuraea sp. SYSU D8015 TaxID=2593644 RepID=UPI001CB6FA64|nr:DUF427 domain-containing protein [Nonomuraea sp. SYSU D8015]